MFVDDFFSGFTEMEKNNFKKAARTLLEHTFVVKEKDEQMFRFLAQRVNRDRMSEYFQAIGYDMKVSDDLGVAMLIQAEDDEMGKLNRKDFGIEAMKLLVVLLKLYRGKYDINLDPVVQITYGELIDNMNGYGTNWNKSKMSSALSLFKRFNLIDYIAWEMDEKKEDAKRSVVIRLYPSLAFGINWDQFKVVVEELISTFELNKTNTEKETDK